VSSYLQQEDRRKGSRLMGGLWFLPAFAIHECTSLRLAVRGHKITPSRNVSKWCPFWPDLAQMEITLGFKCSCQYKFWTRKTRPLDILAASIHKSRADLTEFGTGTVRICPPFPIRSTMAQ